MKTVLGTDQFAQQAIETNRLEAMALALAIHEFIIYTTQERQLTQEEALALKPLAKVCKRLTARASTEAMKPKPSPFKFNFKWDELLAVQLCISINTCNQVLQVILGKVQQKAINLNVASFKT
ncbi:hypothetical protein GU926_08305 [Nibribacter ruber]|uniref:Uncharacterized protein n=1 Tax=Nibribacter ruber TaxID=2698458 RepID=A0A6P1NZL1_9BACT|nr:hypothetical protein [Nibribacter ruber]QHL87438.1 hypothetical protein GU926_08305 [Nibribacter ruber]